MVQFFVHFFCFQVARNLMRRSAHRRPKRIANAAFRLLNVCLGIIDRKKHPQVGLLLLKLQFYS